MSNFFDMACNTETLLHRSLTPFASPEVQGYEMALCRYFGVEEAIAVASGTAAIHCALAALDIGPGDEVLVPSLAVVMSIVPVLYQGATPIFVDSAPGRVDFDYEDLERKITPRTKAILPVYLWGCGYTMDQLMQVATMHHLAVIEDACQAHGSQWQGRYLGTWGKIGCFSTKDGKIMSTWEGGFLLTNDHHLAEKCRALRTHWAKAAHDPTHYSQLGYNYRFPEVLAWLGHKQVDALDRLLAHRYAQSMYLLKGLATELESYHYAGPERSNLFSPVFLLSEEEGRKGIAARLAKRGVANSVGSFGLKPAHLWPIFAHCSPHPIVTPHTQQFLSRVLAISVLPQYTDEELDGIIEVITSTLGEG
ncbi:polysaccharide biosynthesis protein [Ktedonobacteria bacterium brp13]|nr:polysaccharide biosynthesis protein [Ktedonobacteria bacterium brp13]